MLPESPRWLIKVGRNEEALEVITVLRGDGNPNAPGVQEEYNGIVAGVELEKRHAKRNSFYAMLFGRHCGDLHFARRVQIAMWIPILTLVGYVAFIVFAHLLELVSWPPLSTPQPSSNKPATMRIKPTGFLVSITQSVFSVP